MNKPIDRLAKRSGSRLSTTGGNPFADKPNVLTADARGPLLQPDCQLIENVARQNRGRLSERLMDENGWRPYGTLTITRDISQFARAKLLQACARTNLVLRFSTVSGGARGQVLQVEGSENLVGNNTLVSFVRGPYEFPNFVLTQNRHSLDPFAFADCYGGFLRTFAGEAASGDDPDVRPLATDRRAQSSTKPALRP
ncbi:catalase [Paraburkholderia sp. DGU8]|uniref:catalase n=1 Tax=Paraburkholderia sp. DGU8 TaxID=3161997 RepID=UPI003467E06F